MNSDPREIAREIAPGPVQYMNDERAVVTHALLEAYPNYVTRKEFETEMNKLRSDIDKKLDEKINKMKGELQEHIDGKFNEFFRFFTDLHNGNNKKD